MKKILVLINDCQIPDTAFRFAVDLAVENKGSLFGIFTLNQKYNEDSSIFSNGKTPLNNDDTTKSKQDEQLLERSIRMFTETCQEADVIFKIHTISNNHLDTLIDYSAFADIIICDADTPPILYSMNAFYADAHCPVLLINKDYSNTDLLVFAYDDKLSSIYAIRLFTYLFHSYKNLPVHFVSVLPANVRGLEYGDLIKEWLPLHYPNAKIEIIKGDTKDELTNYINGLSNPLIVMSAFGRSTLSRFFKESLANHIITQTNAPIFIAHN